MTTPNVEQELRTSISPQPLDNMDATMIATQQNSALQQSINPQGTLPQLPSPMMDYSNAVMHFISTLNYHAFQTPVQPLSTLPDTSTQITATEREANCNTLMHSPLLNGQTKPSTYLSHSMTPAGEESIRIM